MGFAGGEGVPVMVRNTVVADLRDDLALAGVFKDDCGLGRIPLFFEDAELADEGEALRDKGIVTGATICVVERVLPTWDQALTESHKPGAVALED